MSEVNSFLEKLNKWIGKEGRFAFFATLIAGVISHMPILVSDIPNHDGLGSVYFDQNMITSGRWFLGTACGVSSFYSIPWLIGILSLTYLGITAVILVKLLQVKEPLIVIIIGGILASFPSVASNFAYVFTMDGYMIGLLLAVLSVYCVSLSKFGFILGGIALAFSIGTYQAYLSVAILLSFYMALSELAKEGELKNRFKNALKYLYMGIIGAALYYVILKVMLLIQGKTLDTYQGIDSLNGGEKEGILSVVKKMYVDFAAFSLKGNVLFTNGFALTTVIALTVAFFAALIYSAIKKNWLKKPLFYVLFVVSVIMVPIFTNVILAISANVTYHLLMRYQWAFIVIIAIAFINKVLKENEGLKTLAWITVVAGLVTVFCYMINDNIAYSNLTKKYEKTYAYCLRLADRIEQTEGYYQGIPIYMIGVVGDENFPVTDITADVTDHMLGISGDYLFYTAKNYELFYKHYMGITFNFLSPGEANYYDTEEYVAMPSFPATGSTKVVDGVLYVKTENMH